jgi:hypothetical protein
MGATGEALLYTREFALILALGSPLMITNMALSETIRGEGAATASMTGMILSVVVNILLDPVFIFVLKMNVMGAALATVIANGAAVAYFIWYIQAKSRVQSISIKDFRPNKEILSNIFKIGSAAFLFSALAIISTSLFNTYALHYGDNVIAAFGIANRIVQICEFLGSGLFTGVVPLIAYSYAAGNQKRLNQVVSTTTFFFVGITLDHRDCFHGISSADLQPVQQGPRCACGRVHDFDSHVGLDPVHRLHFDHLRYVSSHWRGNTSEHHGHGARPGPDPDHLPWEPDAWLEWGDLGPPGGRNQRLFGGHGVMAGFRKKIYGSSA